MPCGPGDVFDSRDSGGLTRGGEAHARGPSAFPHTPLNLSGGRCGASTPTIRLHQGQRARLRLQLVDLNGQKIPIPQNSSNESESESPVRFRFVMKEYSGAGSALLDVEGSLLDAADSIVEVDVEPNQLCRAGIFTAQLQAYAEDGCLDCGFALQGHEQDALFWVTPYWVEVAPSHHMVSGGPPTLGELRMLMRDQCPESNELLGDFEYSDDEIAHCIMDPVDQFNITRPPITRYTVSSFPRQYRYYWLRAAMANLMELAARHYLREHLAYNAGGVQVDDKNKYDAYMRFAKDLRDRWEQFIVDTKARLNLGRCWGSVGSPYRRSAR